MPNIIISQKEPVDLSKVAVIDCDILGSKVALRKVGAVAVPDSVELVPQMGSDSANGYVITYSGAYDANYYGYKAFDNDNSTYYCWYAPASISAPGWLQVKLPTARKLSKYAITNRNYTTPSENPKTWKLEGSSDGTTWNILHTVNNSQQWNQNEKREYFIGAVGPYSYFRLTVSETQGATYVGIGELDLYGITEADAVVPSGTFETPNAIDLGAYFRSFDKVVMNTSTTAPASGYGSIDLTDSLPTSAFTCFNQYNSTYAVSRAFDAVINENNAGWQSQTIVNNWARVDFGSAKRIGKFVYQSDAYSNYTASMKDFRIEASDDGNTWVTQYTGQAQPNGNFQVFTFTPTKSFRYWRIFIVNNWGSSWLIISDFQFYEVTNVVGQPKATVYTSSSADNVTFTPFVATNADGTILSPVGRFLKIRVMLEGGAMVSQQTLIDFVPSDASRFSADSQVAFDGSMHLQTNYVVPMVKDTTVGSGLAIFRATIQLDTAKIERGEVR